MPDGPLTLDASSDPALEAAHAAARSLIGAPIDAIELVSGAGRNSRVYRVQSGADSFALKQYPSRDGDPRNRLATETEALRLMAGYGIDAVPRVLASDVESGCALLSWIDGEPVAPASAADIDTAAEFLTITHALRHAARSRRQPLAAEACLFGAEIAAQLTRRLERLGAVASTDPALAAFLDRLASSLFGTLLPAASGGYEASSLSFTLPLAVEAQSLCPSDFGFHNALRTTAGLVFLDFEYFGWDDPAKLVCDFLLHPGMHLAAPLKARFIAAVLPTYSGDRYFLHRLRLLYPLFAVRWCLILLNEFLTERWANRVRAGDGGGWEAAKARQLDRASALLDALQSQGGGFPYDL